MSSKKEVTTVKINGKIVKDTQNIPFLNLNDPNKPLISGNVTEPVEIIRKSTGNVYTGSAADIIAQMRNNK